MSAPGTFTVTAPLKFQIGARTLLALSRRLVRVAWTLDDALDHRFKPLPSLGKADGYLLTSMPETLLTEIGTAGYVSYVRQRYTRSWIDLTIGHAAWLATLSGNTRSGLKRKAKRLGGEVRAYRTAEEIAAFHAIARPLSALTYQERLLGSGLPATPDVLILAAEADAMRAWLLFHEGAPIAYLCCGSDGDTLLYNHVGHDPAFGHLSPGSVLQAEALRQLFADRFTRFDFTEGEGQHKRQFATGGEPCVDLLLLRPTLGNRAALAALAGFDRAVASAKRAAGNGVLKRVGDRVRRA